MSPMRNASPTPKKDPKTGVWRFVFDSVHPNPDGSRRQIPRRGFPTRAAAKAELDRLRQEDADLAAPAANGLSVGDVMESFVADTGARAGEVAGLRWANVDLEGGTLTITGQLASDPIDSKVLSDRPTKRPRSKSTLGLHPATVASLKRRRSEQAADRLVMGTGWPTTGVAADLVFTWADGAPPIRRP
jgi:integrase